MENNSSENENGLVDDFFGVVWRDDIVSFIKQINSSPGHHLAMSASGNRLEDIAAYAAKLGYKFPLDVLDSFCERRIAHKLPEWQRRLRQEFSARQKSDEIPAPKLKDESFTAKVSKITYQPGFVLDRKHVLDGHILTLHGVPAVAKLVACIGATLEQALKPHTPSTAYQIMEAVAYDTAIKGAYKALKDNAEIPLLMGEMIVELGYDPKDTLYEWPGFRVITPKGGGHYRDGGTQALGPHRDTWYGSPHHQINLWGPVYPLPPGTQLKIMPEYFRRSVDNSSPGYDTCKQAVGLSGIPVCRGKVDMTDCVAPPLDVGDLLCYSGHHMHASGVNIDDVARISFEVRLLHESDRKNRVRAENVDFFGVTEIYDGWYDHHGQEVETGA
ncbi:MAG: hypothetical protein HOI33_08960 [Rhodospirillaceae bacterium]|jgi:hypothetical protein|nr:hypothetical protein [Rhodospirillaceae bacterium]